MSSSNPNGNSVIVQKWEESELNWGTRPDGYSVHLTDDDRKAFVKEYWDGIPEEIQEEYSRTDGTPYTAQVSDETFAEVKASKNGVRVYSNEYPGSGGTDGWVPHRP